MAGMVMSTVFTVSIARASRVMVGGQTASSAECHLHACEREWSGRVIGIENKVDLMLTNFQSIVESLPKCHPGFVRLAE